MFPVSYGKVYSASFVVVQRLTIPVNEILGDHNVDKQMTDNKGEVG